MDPSMQALQEHLNQLYGQLDEVLNEIAVIRRQSPRLKGETAKMLENYMILVSRRVKEVGRKYNDDVLEGVSLLKIKMMG